MTDRAKPALATNLQTGDITVVHSRGAGNDAAKLPAESLETALRANGLVQEVVSVASTQQQVRPATAPRAIQHVSEAQTDVPASRVKNASTQTADSALRLNGRASVVASEQLASKRAAASSRNILTWEGEAPTERPRSARSMPNASVYQRINGAVPGLGGEVRPTTPARKQVHQKETAKDVIYPASRAAPMSRAEFRRDYFNSTRSGAMITRNTGDLSWTNPSAKGVSEASISAKGRGDAAQWRTVFARMKEDNESAAVSKPERTSAPQRKRPIDIDAKNASNGSAEKPERTSAPLRKRLAADAQKASNGSADKADSRPADARKKLTADAAQKASNGSADKADSRPAAAQKASNGAADKPERPSVPPRKRPAASDAAQKASEKPAEKPVARPATAGKRPAVEDAQKASNGSARPASAKDRRENAKKPSELTLPDSPKSPKQPFVPVSLAVPFEINKAVLFGKPDRGGSTRTVAWAASPRKDKQAAAKQESGQSGTLLATTPQSKLPKTPYPVAKPGAQDNAAAPDTAAKPAGPAPMRWRIKKAGEDDQADSQGTAKPGLVKSDLLGRTSVVQVSAATSKPGAQPIVLRPRSAVAASDKPATEAVPAEQPLVAPTLSISVSAPVVSAAN